MRKLLIILALTASACGSDNSKDNHTAPVVTEEDAPLLSIAVTDEASLPSCVEKNDKQLVYVMSMKEFRTCQAGLWEVIDVGATSAVSAIEPVSDIIAALASITLKTAVGSLSAAGQALLGSSITEVTTLSTDFDSCRTQLPPGVEATVYQNKGHGITTYTDGTSTISYTVTFRSGVVNDVYYQVDNKPAVSRSLTCAER